MSHIRVSGLHIYPVKAMQGRPVQKGEVTTRGLKHDRRFMLVDPDGEFVTQRNCPRLAAYVAYIYEVERGLELSIVDTLSPGPPLPKIINWVDGEIIPTTVWDDQVEAVAQKDSFNEILSHKLGRPVRLVYMPDSTRRSSRRQADEVTEPVITNFADAYPFLLTSQESLDDLNSRIEIGSEVDMDRFRPNIVVEGCVEPFEEETWRVFRIGPVTFFNMKRCVRCVVTTLDQQTGASTGKEPLRTLSKYRRSKKGACFGMNLNHSGLGTIRVGDRIEIIERGPPFVELDILPS